MVVTVSLASVTADKYKLKYLSENSGDNQSRHSAVTNPIATDQSEGSVSILQLDN